MRRSYVVSLKALVLLLACPFSKPLLGQFCTTPFSPCDPEDPSPTSQCFNGSPRSPKCAKCETYCRTSPCIAQTGNYLASAAGLSLQTNGISIDVGLHYQSAVTLD